MKRLMLCTVILIILVSSSVIMIFVVKNLNKELCDKIDKAVSLWEDDKPEETLEIVNEITESWGRYYKAMSVIVRNDKLQSISNSVSKLKPLLKFDNDEFYSECESIKYSLKMIYQSELPYPYNVV